LLPLGKWAEHPEKYGFKINDFEEYKIIGMNYNIKQYLPHYLWDTLPYSINNKTHKELILESSKFMEEIESHGVLTMILDEAVMMAHFIDKKPLDFRNLMKNTIFTGDYERLNEVVNEINKNLGN